MTISVCAIGIKVAGRVEGCWLLIIARCVKNSSIVASVCEEDAVVGQ